MPKASLFLLFFTFVCFATVTIPANAAVQYFNCAQIGSVNSVEIWGVNNDKDSIFINGTVANCNISIHDCQILEIIFNTSITSNSNITIRNVTSSRSGSEGFIHFDGNVTDFGFITIDQVYHSDKIYGHKATAANLVFAVSFNEIVIGRSDQLSSTIEIKNVFMSNINTNGTLSGSSELVNVLRFMKTVSNVSSILLQNVTARNISVTSESSTQAMYISSIRFADMVSNVSRIQIQDVTFENLFIDGKPAARPKIIYFQTDVTANNNNNNNNNNTIFLMSNVTSNNFTTSSRPSEVDYTLLFFGGKVTNFNIINITNVATTQINGVAKSSFGSIYLIMFASIASATSNSSLFILNQLRLSNSTIQASTTCTHSILVIVSVLTYHTVDIQDILVENISSNTSSGASSMSMLNFSSEIKSNAIANPSSELSESSSLTFSNIFARAVTLQSTSGESFCYVVTAAASVRLYNSINFTDIEMADIYAGPRTSFMATINISDSLVASTDAVNSSLVVANISYRRVTIIAVNLPEARAFRVVNAIQNFNTVRVTNFTISDISMRASAGSGILWWLNVNSGFQSSAGNSVYPLSAVPSLLISSISLQNVNVTAIGVTMYLIKVSSGVQATTGFNSVEMSNIHMKNIYAVASTNDCFVVAAYLNSFLPPALGSTAASKNSSSFVVNNVSMRNVAIASNNSNGYLLAVHCSSGVINFHSIVVSNIAVDNATQSGRVANMATVSVVNLAPNESMSAFSSVLVENVTLTNSVVIGSTQSNFQSMMWSFVSNYITNYSSVTFKAVLIRNNTLKGYFGTLYVVYAGKIVSTGFNTTPSLLVANVSAFSNTFSTQSSLTASVFQASALENFTNVNFSDISLVGCDVLSSSMTIRVVYLSQGSATGNSWIAETRTSRQTSMTIRRVTCTDISARKNSASASSIYLISFATTSVTNFSAITVSDLNLSYVNISSSIVATAAFVHVLHFSCLVTVTSSTSSSSFSLQRVRVDSLEVNSEQTVSRILTTTSFFNYDSIVISDITTTNSRFFSTSNSVVVFLLYFNGLNGANYTSNNNLRLNNSIVFDSVEVHNVTVNGTAPAPVPNTYFAICGAGSAVDNYTMIRISNIHVSDVIMFSGNNGATFIVAWLISSLNGPSNSSSWSPSLENENSSKYNNVTYSRILVANNSLSRVFVNTSAGAGYVAMFVPSLGVTRFTSVLVNNNSMKNLFVSSPTIASLVLVYAVGIHRPIENFTSKFLAQNNRLDLSGYYDASRGSSSLIPMPANIAGRSVTANLIMMNVNSKSTTATNTYPAYGFVADIEDNSVEILDSSWQNVCDQFNCSLLRMSSIAPGTDYDQNTTINLYGNSIKSMSANTPKLSLVSFATLTNPTGSVYPSVIFTLKNNYLNLTQNNKIISFDGLYNTQNGVSFLLPTLVLVNMDCNRWQRSTETMMVTDLQHGTSINADSKFFAWNCVSHSSSRSLSLTVSETTVSSSKTQNDTVSVSYATQHESNSSSNSLSKSQTIIQKKNRTLTKNETESLSITADLTSSESLSETRTRTKMRSRSLLLHKKTSTKTTALLRPATTIVPPTPLPLPPPTTTSTSTPPRRNNTRTETQTLIIVVPQIAVVAPPVASATASIAAAAGGAVGGDVASPTQAARALSLAAIATACANDVVYVPAPPPDEQLPWPQGSLIPQIQISLPNEDAKDSWRKHFRGAILANFIVFPLIILCIVIPLIYGIRFTKLQNVVSAKYLFSAKKSIEVEERDPDLIADARLFGVILFLFGLGLESATCAFTTLLASPRETSDSLGIDIFLCLLAITIIIVALILLLKVEIGANEKLECVRADITFKSDEKTMSEGKRKMARFLLGSLCWTYRGSLDSEEKIEEGKTFFLRNRNLFASNQGPHEETSQNSNKNEITLATKANNKINEESNSIARKISVFASFVDCVLTVIAGLIRGLITAGVLPCGTAIILLVISQALILLWASFVQSSLYPVTKILNVLMSFLLLGAALATLVKFKEASTFAVSVAMILSFLGMLIVFLRLFVRRVFGIIVYPKREKIVEEMKQEIQDSQAASLAAPLFEYSNSNNNNNNFNEVVDDDEFGDVELLTAPHSPTQGPSEIEINISLVDDDGDVDIDLSELMENNYSNNNNPERNENDAALQNFDLNAFVVDDVPPSAGDGDLYASISAPVQALNDDENDGEETLQIRKNKLTSEALVDSKDLYESETKEEKLKRLLAELEDDSELNEAIEKRRAEERNRKQTMTKEQQEENLKKIQKFLGRK